MQSDYFGLSLNENHISIIIELKFTMNRLFIIFIFLFFINNTTAQKLKVANLRCEYRHNPLGVGADKPRFSWELQSTQQNVLQTAYRIIIAGDSSQLQKNNGNIWDSKKIMAATSIQVQYNGRALRSAKKYFWKIMVWDNKGNASNWSNIAQWQMGLLNASDWKNASWIGYESMPDSNKIIPYAHGDGKKEWGSRRDILPLLRKNFSVTKQVKRVTVFICGLGHFDMSINGEKVGDHFLDPGWTQYSKHALYVTFDITNQLQQGNNVIGVMLGNGFYYIPGERYRKLTGAYGYPKMICRICIEYADGSSNDIVSNDTWKTAPSPIIFSSIYGGEDYDANLEQDGWNKPGFDDSKWKQVVITTGPPQLDAQTAEPLKIMQRFAPVSKTKLKATVWDYDLGQNFSGIPFITVSGKKGDTLCIVPSELINKDGSPNQEASGGPCYYKYILKGTGKESWHPQFSYYGFRYMQVQGAIGEGENNPDRLPVIENIVGLHTRNSAAIAGNFTSSSRLFNKTSELINWAIKSNTASVFTDCPHREKLGWLEETHLVGSSVQYNFDIAGMCRKVIKDMMNAQTEDGMIPEIAPEFVHFDEPFRDSPEWGSAAIILPWYNYQWYADKQTLADAFSMMQLYIGYLKKKSVDNILSEGLGDWYDIGPKPPGVSQLTPKGVTGTATYYYDLTIIMQTAALLGKDSYAKEYEQLAAAVKKSFNKKFFNDSTKEYATGSQAANAMALFMGLVEPQNKKAVIDNLVKDIRDRNNALTAGDIGYRYVLRALEDAGRSDVIFDMNSRSDVPGYGFQLAHGATALTESWQAFPDESNNHFMLGHLMEWFYAGLCGIQQSGESVGYNKIVIRPQAVGDITSAKAEYHSPYGMIKTDWNKKSGLFELRVSIPVNTTAEIILPGNVRPVKTGSGDYVYTTKIDASSEILTSRKKGFIKDEFIFEHASFPSCHASTIAETPAGLIAAWFGGTNEGNKDVCIWGSRLINNKWTVPQIIADGVMNDSIRYACYNPVLYQVRGGELLLFYKIGPDVVGWTGWMVRSKDNGITWSKREALPAGFLGPIKNKPVLINGALVCPSSTEKNGWQAHFEYTKDKGKSWTKSADLNDGFTVSAIQPSILKFADGRLEIVCRSQNKTINESWSNDGGKTWSTMIASSLPNNNSGTDAVTLKDGWQLLVYNHVKPDSTAVEGRGLRSPLNIAISKDGEHWNAAMVLEDSPGEYSYPSIIQTKDGRVHIVYTWKRQRIKHVVIDASKLNGQPIINEQWPVDMNSK